MLTKITPLILTCNEDVNIERCLLNLCWARDIVILDSFSSDSTIAIARKFAHVRVFKRKFDSFANQWNYAIKKTFIKTDWVLALDADFMIGNDFVKELRSLDLNDRTAGYRSKLIYCMAGRPIKCGILPSLIVLFRQNAANYIQDGHAQKVVVSGEIRDLSAVIMHDDRKSFGQWFKRQNRYSILEAEKLCASKGENLDWADRIRKLILPMPFAALIYVYFIKGGMRDGIRGVHYAFERGLAELILSIHILRRNLKERFVKRKSQ